jgi:hypothetical protein
MDKFSKRIRDRVREPDQSAATIRAVTGVRGMAGPEAKADAALRWLAALHEEIGDLEAKLEALARADASE